MVYQTGRWIEWVQLDRRYLLTTPFQESTGPVVSLAAAANCEVSRRVQAGENP
jgi:hypothetical protein